MDKSDQPFTGQITVTKIPQPHGGALNSGGTPGHKGGRPPKTFLQRMQALADRGTQALEIAAILDDPADPQFLDALKWAADRGYGKAPQPITGADLGPIQTADVTVLQAELRNRLAHLMPRAE